MKLTFKFSWIFTLVLALMLTISSCGNGIKSELVRQLEKIFYDPSFASVPDKTISASDFGAVGDGIRINTKAIQQAIDNLAETGGGRLVFDPGTYLTGALFLKSNVELHLGEKVILKAIHDEEAYPDIQTRVAGIEMEWPAALINVYRAKNVRITGKGTLDGNGKYWWDKFWGDPPRSGGMWTSYQENGVRWAVDYDCKRVRALVVYESEDVLLQDFSVLRSGFWTLSLTYSKRVHVSGIVIRNNIGGFGPSSDGINTDSSSEILVEDCDIDCNDDNLCIKSGRDSDGLRVNRPAENIVYRNSITRAGHGLFTLGSETSGGMRNIEVYGLRAVGTNTGIRFKSARVRGGVIENIWFHDIEMDSVASPFQFELDWYPSYSYPKIPKTFSLDSVPAHWLTMTTPVEPPEKGIPEFKNIRFSRITAHHSGRAIYVNAYPEKPMRNLKWENVYVQAAKAGVIRHASFWEMKDVTFDISDDQGIEYENCVDLETPEMLIMEAYEGSAVENQEEARVPEEEEQIWISQKIKEPLLVNLEGAEKVVHMEDTISSDSLFLVLPPGDWDEFTFFEPLGDGFYYGTVRIKYAKEEGILKVKGEHGHFWKIYRQSESGQGRFLEAGEMSPVFTMALDKK